MTSKSRTSFVDWREDMPEASSYRARTIRGADSGAPAPIVGFATKRANEIHKLHPKATSLKGSCDKFGNVCKFHPDLFTIHAKVFNLPYPDAVENAPLTISETILDYSTMSDADRLELATEEQEQSATSAISRLTTSDASESREVTAARNAQLDHIRKALSLRNKLVKMH